MVIRFTYLIIILLFYSCVTKRIEFRDIEKQIDLIDNKQVIKDSAFLINGIYLNIDFYSKLIELESIKSGKDIFTIDQKDKKKISLSKNYSDIRKLIEPIDIQLVRFFQNEFGIENPDKNILSKSLVFKNKIFVEFISDLGENAFVLELVTCNVVEVQTAFIIID